MSTMFRDWRNTGRVVGFGLGLCVVSGLSISTGQIKGVSQQPRRPLSPQEQVEAADMARAKAADLSNKISTMLDNARKESDMIKLTCLDERLSQVNAAVRSIDQRAAAIKDAVRSGDDARRNHEFNVLSELDKKLGKLSSAASRCIGKDVSDSGGANVVVTVDTTVPVAMDPGTVTVAAPPAVIPYVPPPASPVL